MRLAKYQFYLEREPLVRPFVFKGGSFREKWLAVTILESESGGRALGVGGFAVLWSDPDLFFRYSETGGNVVMAAMAERAAQLALDCRFSDPIQLLREIFEPLHQFGSAITGRRDLRKTFTLNSLVSLDNALWKCYALERNITDFDHLIPPDYREAFSGRQQRLACIPLLTSNLPPEELDQLIASGHFFFKIKLGAAGSREEMLRKDLAFLEKIQRRFAGHSFPAAPDGNALYYLDANGRYPDKATLVALVEGIDRLGMLPQVAVMEEPFPEEQLIDVADLPIRFAADESLHGSDDVNRRIDLGYRAIALKPAGKTLSMSLLMGMAAYRRGVPCYVADSACLPAALDWNKNIAARLANFPGLNLGVIESNGPQNYRRWRSLLENHPAWGAPWLEPVRGCFELNDDFYRQSGGIFAEHRQYLERMQEKGDW